MPGKKKTTTVHRLEDLEVHEVSIVDRPANLRPFLMVKNEDGEPVELERDAEGNLVARKKAASPDPKPATKTDMDTITALIKALGAQLSTLEKADPIAKRLAIPEELRSKAFKEARGAMQRIDTAMATMSMADISDDGSPEFMKLIGDELGEVSKILGALSRAFGKAPTTKSDDTDAALESKLEALTEDVNSIVEKAGRKMAARRLTAFRSALDTLTSVLNELDPPKDKSATKKSDETAAELEKARAELDTLKKSLEGAGAKIEELTKTVKDQASQIRKAREARPASNAVTVEEVTKGDPSEADDSWPLDMNNEKSRRTVDKSVSFY